MAITKDPRVATFDSRYADSGYGGIGEGIDWNLDSFTPQSIARPTGVTAGRFAGDVALGQSPLIQNNIANGMSSMDYSGINVPTPEQSAFATQYGLDYNQSMQANPAALQVNQDFTNTMGGIATPDVTKGIVDGATNLGMTGDTPNGSAATMDDYWKEKAARLNKLNNPDFDWTGAANLGLSAFNTWNNYNMQNEQMDLYKQDLNKKWADQDRRDLTRKEWSSAFKNA